MELKQRLTKEQEEYSEALPMFSHYTLGKNVFIQKVLQQEFPDVIPNSIFRDDDGNYRVFGHYRIEPVNPGYRVYCAATEVGIFNTTKSALSWCIADKHCAYNTARELLLTDSKLQGLIQDISVRTAIAERSKNLDFRDNIGTKLESKIIHKKQLENQLAKCVNWAKYIQQRGFENETARTGRNQPNKTSR